MVILYHWTAQDLAEAVADGLRTRGRFPVWVDTDVMMEQTLMLGPMENFHDRAQRALQRARGCILLVTQAFFTQSLLNAAELDKAMDRYAAEVKERVVDPGDGAGTAAARGGGSSSSFLLCPVLLEPIRSWPQRTLERRHGPPKQAEELLRELAVSVDRRGLSHRHHQDPVFRAVGTESTGAIGGHQDYQHYLRNLEPSKDSLRSIRDRLGAMGASVTDVILKEWPELQELARDDYPPRPLPPRREVGKAYNTSLLALPLGHPEAAADPRTPRNLRTPGGTTGPTPWKLEPGQRLEERLGLPRGEKELRLEDLIPPHGFSDDLAPAGPWTRLPEIPPPAFMRTVSVSSPLLP